MKQAELHAQVLRDCRWQLGAGMVWNVADASIYFVDIQEPVGPAGFDQGVAALRMIGGGGTSVEWLHRLHDAGSPLRLNDAKADAKGRDPCQRRERLCIGAPQGGWACHAPT